MTKKDILISLIVALFLAGIISLFASSSPDGLERVAEDKNFIKEATNVIQAPIPDYLFPKINNEKLAGSVAGVVGVLIVFTLGIILARFLKEK